VRHGSRRPCSSSAVVTAPWLLPHDAKEHKKEVESMQSEMKDLRVHITTRQHALAATQVIRSKLQSSEIRRCDEQT
jgi:hypothetical protein